MELRWWGLNNASDMVEVSFQPEEPRYVASTMSFSARRAVKTTCEELSVGLRWSRMAGIASTAYRGARKEGPPVVLREHFIWKGLSVILTICEAGNEL